MKKKYYLYMILGIAFAMFIIPGVCNWLGITPPSKLIADGFTAVFGESNGFNGVLAFITAGALIVLLIFGATKLTKKMEKSK